MSQIFKSKEIDTKITEKEGTKDNSQNEKELKNLYREDQDKLEKPRNFTRIVVLMIFLATFAGLISGFIAVISFFSGGLHYLGIKAEDVFPTQEMTIENKETVNVFEDEKFINVLGENHKSLVYVFNKKRTSENILNNVYLEKEALAEAVVLTDDGWLVSTSDISLKKDDSHVVVTFDDQVLDVEKSIRDPFSKLVFIKLKNAQNLSSVTLGTGSHLSSGNKVLALSTTRDGQGKVNVSRIIENNWLPIAKSTDLTFLDNVPGDYLLISNVDSSLRKGSPIFSLNGDVIGLVESFNSEGVVVRKTEDYSSAFNHILNGEENWPLNSIGISFLDSNYVLGDSIKIKNDENVVFIENGILVLSIKKDSPASSSKILVGDVITKVDNVNLSSEHNFSRSLQKYKSGDIVILTIMRNGETEEVLITVEI
jgi:S1-C subfamily serine protease